MKARRVFLVGGAVGALLIALMSLVGYATGATWLYAWSPTPMAVNTAIGIAAVSLAVALLLAERNGGGT